MASRKFDKSKFEKSLDLLKKTKNYDSAEVGRALDCVLFHNTDGVECHKEARKLGFGLGELFLRILKSLGHKFTELDNSQGTRNLHSARWFFWNYTDTCPDFGCELGKSGVIALIVNILSTLAKQSETSWITKRVNSLMGILHNSIRHDECIAANRSIYRQAGAVEILQNWIHSKDMTLKVKSLLILSYITDKDESEILAKNGKAVAFLVDKLKEGVHSSEHRARIGHTYFSVTQLLKGLNHLVVHDANKKIVLDNGGIPVITNMLKSDFSHEEQDLAVKALWSLSFDDTVKKSSAIGKSLTALKALSDDVKLRDISKRAIFEIEDEYTSNEEEEEEESDEEKEDEHRVGDQKSHAKTQATAEDSDGHGMISYNWAHQDTAFKIRDELTKRGYKVWIDVEKMRGCTLDCMHKAVKQADTVLLCMSQHYYASTSCRQEAKLAAKKKKKLIPVIVEPGYEPDGWLEILIEDLLYYMVNSEDAIHKNMPEIVKGITNLRVENDDKAADASKTGPVTTPVAADSALSWSCKRVQEWFEEIGIPILQSKMDFATGKDLHDLYIESRDNREDFKTTCEECDLKTSLLKKRLRSELRKLFD